VSLYAYKTLASERSLIVTYRKGSRRIVLGHGVSSGVLIDQVEHSMQKERVLPGKVSFLYKQSKERSGNELEKAEDAERGVLAPNITEEKTTYELLAKGFLRRTEAFR
jgi:hypothetical protein